jgi:hypothetical protein
MSRYVQKGHFGPKCPNMVIRAQAPQKLKILEFFIFIRCDLPIRFQQALNHYQEIILCLDTSKKVILVQNAQIW